MADDCGSMDVIFNVFQSKSEIETPKDSDFPQKKGFLGTRDQQFLDFHLGSVFFRTNLCDMYSQFAWRMRPRNLIPQATGTGGTWGWLKGLQLVDDDLVGGLEHDLYNFPYIGNSNPN